MTSFVLGCHLGKRLGEQPLWGYGHRNGIQSLEKAPQLLVLSPGLRVGGQQPIERPSVVCRGLTVEDLMHQL